MHLIASRPETIFDKWIWRREFLLSQPHAPNVRDAIQAGLDELIACRAQALAEQGMRN